MERVQHTRMADDHNNYKQHPAYSNRMMPHMTLLRGWLCMHDTQWTRLYYCPPTVGKLVPLFLIIYMTVFLFAYLNAKRIASHAEIIVQSCMPFTLPAGTCQQLLWYSYTCRF